MLHLVLQRCKASVDFALKTQNSSDKNLAALLPALRDVLMKVPPEFKVLQQCWSKALKKDVKNAEKKESDSEEELPATGGDCHYVFCQNCSRGLGENFEGLGLVSVTNESWNLSDLMTVAKEDHLLKILQNMCLYQTILPDAVSEHPIDFPALLGKTSIIFL